MSIGKLLLLIAILAAIYFIFFKKKSVAKPSKQEPDEEAKSSSDDMVECAKCGTYVRVDEAFIKNARYYCSAECMNG